MQFLAKKIKSDCLVFICFLGGNWYNTAKTFRIRIIAPKNPQNNPETTKNTTKNPRIIDIFAKKLSKISEKSVFSKNFLQKKSYEEELKKISDLCRGLMMVFYI